MSEYIFEGVRCTSNVFYTKTGETKPFGEDTRLDVIKSLISRIPSTEIMSCPKASSGSDTAFQVIVKNGKSIVRGF